MTGLDAAYAEMASDEEREQAAFDWAESTTWYRR